MIRPKFKQADIKKFIEGRIKLIEQQIIKNLHKLGQECVDMSKNGLNIDSSAFPKGDYTDQTADLRNSIGYAIILNGEIISSKIGKHGTTEANNLVKERAAGMRKGYGLVVVAGMDYAEILESKGYNVITSSEIFARNEIPKLIERVKKSLKK